MIIGIGNDIIEVARIKRAIDKDNGFKEKVFSVNEIDLCNSKSNKYQSYAARFAGKEAFMKAIKTGWADGIAWNEIEILSLDSGAPYINLVGQTQKYIQKLGVEFIHVTLSHVKEMATASVILESSKC